MIFATPVVFLFVPSRHRLLLTLAVLGLALFTGCTTPPSHRHGLRQADDQFRTIVLLPIDAEVSELAAGGVTEERDDWTVQVAAHLNAVVTSRHSYRPARPWPAERAAALQTELEDLHAVFRAVTLNQILHTYIPGMPAVPATSGTLVYQVGPIDALLDAQQADAALLLFVRDDYATAGRKGLVVLGALAGIPVRGGVTVSSAALVTRDGRLLWMNLFGAQKGDLRTREGAQALVKALLTGAPAPTPGAAPTAAKTSPAAAAR
jgi:hypothetical protein